MADTCLPLLKGQSPLPGSKVPPPDSTLASGLLSHVKGWGGRLSQLDSRTKPIVVVGLAQPSGGRLGVFHMDMAVEGMSQPLGSGCVPLSHMGQGPCPL